ncbi:hypothetical protein ABZT08_17920 [Streptomyces sp. NPDC005526]|uniref:hypothetical protein n=1 Tax=Streptomyces sp. NPDC005526 TaxID=3156885 RepID=UPI0033B06FE3
MEAWEDGDCPWCRSLLGPGGRAAAEPDPGHRDDGPCAPWVARARLVMVPLAALTVVAALVVALA